METSVNACRCQQEGGDNCNCKSQSGSVDDRKKEKTDLLSLSGGMIKTTRGTSTVTSASASTSTNASRSTSTNASMSMSTSTITSTSAHIHMKRKKNIEDDVQCRKEMEKHFPHQRGMIITTLIVSALLTVKFHMYNLDPTRVVYQRGIEAIAAGVVEKAKEKNNNHLQLDAGMDANSDVDIDVDIDVGGGGGGGAGLHADLLTKTQSQLRLQSQSQSQSKLQLQSEIEAYLDLGHSLDADTGSDPLQQIQEEGKVAMFSKIATNDTVPRDFLFDSARASSKGQISTSMTSKKKMKISIFPPKLDDSALSTPPAFGAPFSPTGKLSQISQQQDDTTGLKLHRIFYFSSFANPNRQKFMQNWIDPLGVPYQRVEPMTGNTSLCEQPYTSSSYCLDALRMTNSYQHFLDPQWIYDTSGSVLILHDDHVSVDMQKLDRFLTNFTERWNVLRLDCNISPHQDPNAIWYPQPDDSASGGPCVQSNAILWRRHSLDKVKEKMRGFKLRDGLKNDLNCILGKRQLNFKTVCVNLGISTRDEGHPLIKRETQKGAVRNSWIVHDIGWSYEQISMEGSRIPIESPNTATRIDRIYYHNLDKNLLRRKHMESWLSQQSIPYERIPAQVGEPTGCVALKNTPNRCRGMSGIAKTLIGIIDDRNVTGVTLVLEDDVFPLDKDYWIRMMEAIKYVPDDWDIIRFDCWSIRDYGMNYVNGFVVDTRKPRKIKDCKHDGVCIPFCGGAYAMLWRDSKVHKLRKMWSKTPVDDADCIIAKTKNIQAYCVNIGLWEHYYINEELSDVSLLDD